MKSHLQEVEFLEEGQEQSRRKSISREGNGIRKQIQDEKLMERQDEKLLLLVVERNRG